MKFYGDTKYLELFINAINDINDFIYKDDVYKKLDISKKVLKYIKDIYISQKYYGMHDNSTEIYERKGKFNLINRKNSVRVILNEKYINLTKDFSVYHEASHALVCASENALEGDYTNLIGTIYDNTTYNNYGVLINENLTDMIAYASLNKNIDLNQVFKYNKDKDLSKLSLYATFDDLTKLSLIAFSNTPNIDYNYLHKKYNLFNGKITYRNGLKGYVNDLLHYHMYDSKKLIDIFDRYTYKGSYIRLNNILDSLLSNAYEGKIYTYDIIIFQIILNEFIENKLNAYLYTGRFNKDDVKNILKEYNIINKRIVNNVRVMMDKASIDSNIKIDNSLDRYNYDWYTKKELDYLYKSI